MKQAGTRYVNKLTGESYEIVRVSNKSFSFIGTMYEMKDETGLITGPGLFSEKDIAELIEDGFEEEK